MDKDQFVAANHPTPWPMSAHFGADLINVQGHLSRKGSNKRCEGIAVILKDMLHSRKHVEQATSYYAKLHQKHKLKKKVLLLIALL